MEEKIRYEEDIKNRSLVRFYIGLSVRFISFLKFAMIRSMARKRGAIIGKDVRIPFALARKANKNLTIGDYSTVSTDKIDLRSKVSIGENCIINDCEIITTSHNVDSPYWECKHYGITIEDHVWIATHALINPACTRIGHGAVIAAGSVIYKDVEQMSIVGNGGTLIKKRKCVHERELVLSLLTRDFREYWKIRFKKQSK